MVTAATMTVVAMTAYVFILGGRNPVTAVSDAEIVLMMCEMLLQLSSSPYPLLHVNTLIHLCELLSVSDCGSEVISVYIL